MDHSLYQSRGSELVLVALKFSEHTRRALSSLSPSSYNQERATLEDKGLLWLRRAPKSWEWVQNSDSPLMQLLYGTKESSLWSIGLLLRSLLLLFVHCYIVSPHRLSSQANHPTPQSTTVERRILLSRTALNCSHSRKWRCRRQKSRIFRKF